MADEKMDEIRAHVAGCRVCMAAKNRANDFCDEGRLMFYAWANVHPPERVEAVEVTKEQYQRMLDEKRRRARQGRRN